MCQIFPYINCSNYHFCEMLENGKRSGNFCRHRVAIKNEISPTSCELLKLLLQNNNFLKFWLEPWNVCLNLCVSIAFLSSYSECLNWLNIRNWLDNNELQYQVLGSNFLPSRPQVVERLLEKGVWSFCKTKLWNWSQMQCADIKLWHKNDILIAVFANLLITRASLALTQTFLVIFTF